MKTIPLYQQIANALRQEILVGKLKPGQQLLSVRQMAGQWACTPGTVQRAYRLLARQGLVHSRSGQGTRVLGADTGEAQGERGPLRQAALVHQAESFLLEALATGYEVDEVERAVRMALDRWRVMRQDPPFVPANTLRFVGSHDPAVSMIAGQFSEIAPGVTLQVQFGGSLGGLMALARQEADLAGSHLWDQRSGTYNQPFVRRLLPGRRVALVTMARRHLGLILPPGNPAGVAGLRDLVRAELRFVNRQSGAGTRVWLDTQLARLGIGHGDIEGYAVEVATHSEVARAVAEGLADVGLGVQTAALSYGLEFLPLALERYELVIPAEVWVLPAVQSLAQWLAGGEAAGQIAHLGGYDVEQTGDVRWVEPDSE